MVRQAEMGIPIGEVCRKRCPERLNASRFLSTTDAKDRIESWRHDYNTARPHSALGNLTPRAFVRQAHEVRTSLIPWTQDRGPLKRPEKSHRSWTNFGGRSSVFRT